ncbi:hypothetical protein JCM12856_21800 [Spirochaeta dissipatitropha]
MDILIIDSNTIHGLASAGMRYFSLLIDPSSDDGRQVRKQYLLNSDTPIVQLQLAATEIGLKGLKESMSIQSIRELSHNLLELLHCFPTTAEHKPDGRIQNVLVYIQESRSPVLSASDAAQIASLSVSRFLAVFRQQTGLPFRNFLLMQKLIRGIHLLEETRSFTEAAHTAGFADAAHFTRTFKNSTGMNLKELFKNSQFVQVFFDPGLYHRDHEHNNRNKQSQTSRT